MTAQAGIAPGAATALHTEALLTNRCAAVYVAGELDLATAEQLVQTVRTCLAQRPGVVRVDVSELAFCDWYGLKTLLGLSLEARRAGTALTLAGTVRPQLARLLAATGADHLLTATGARAARAAGALEPAGRGHCPAPAAPPQPPQAPSGAPSARPAAVPEHAAA
ncbi:hypothetical protein SUDANB176_06651 [Streptomyces sp. enrichment culture]|uniref:STAS domain-containing protein n=1 Tax=Streptomyces sp. enrichment culture TaxID=1795815 RepID=UPI003F5720EE